MTNLTYKHPETVETPSGFFLNYSSTVTNGAWGYLILVMVFSISYLALANYNSRRSFAASSFLTWTVTILLTSFGVVGGYAFTLTSLMLIASILVNHHGGSRGGDALV